MEYFTIKEVAEELSTNEETVRRWIRDGKLQATRRASKLGYLISSDDLKSFLGLHKKYKSKVTAGSALAVALGAVFGGVPGAVVAGAMVGEFANLESTQTYVGKDVYESFPVAQSKEADHPATLALPTAASDRVENTETPLLASENTGPSSDVPDLFSEKHDTEALPADDATDLDRLETAIYKKMKEIKEKISVLELEQERIASQLMIYKDQLAVYEKQLEISKILRSKG